MPYLEVDRGICSASLSEINALGVRAELESKVIRREQPMKPAYFDLTVKDLGRARAFFENVFGWRFERFSMPYEYYRIQAGNAEEPGIDGGIGAIQDTEISGGEPLTQVTIPVPNLDDFISKVSAAGGLIVEPKTPIPGIGWYATCAEPGGLKFGMIQADPDAK